MSFRLFQRGHWPYALGAIVLIASLFCYGYMTGSTVPAGRMSRGTFYAFTALPLIAVHFLLQLAVRRLLCRQRLSVLQEAIVLNLPITFLMTWMLITGYRASSPFGRFERYFVKPVPQSVRNLQLSGTTYMDGCFWVLWFRIDPQDLSNMRQALQMMPPDEPKSREDWQSLMVYNAGIEFGLKGPFDSYVVKRHRVERWLLCDSNASVAYLVYRQN